MKGPDRLPKCGTEFVDAHVSVNIAKVAGWKSSQCSPRSSSAPRLLLVLLLLAQVVFLAMVRLVPGGFSWLSNPDDALSSFAAPSASIEGLASSASYKTLPASLTSSSTSNGNGDGEANTFGDQTSTTTEVLRDRKHYNDSSMYVSINKRDSSVKQLEGDEERATHEKHPELILTNAAALPTSVDVAEEEHALIAKTALGNEEVEGDKKALHYEYNAETQSVPFGNMTATTPSSKCKYGYVYVYDLPPIYNQDIIGNCTALNIYIDVCDNLLNDGLGLSLGDASPLGQVHSWFKSDQFTTEIVFHKRMLEHPCRTDNPEEAYSFYVPYYAGLDVGRYLWAGFSAEMRDNVSNQLLEWLVQQPAWKRSGGWGHFLMIGRVSWDFRRLEGKTWGSSFFYHPSMQNVTRLLIESNPWDYMEMAVPYPTNFHPQCDQHLVAWQNHIRDQKRDHLFAFAGAPRPAFQDDFRSLLLNQCLEAQSCQSLDCSNGSCDSGQKTLELFMNSKFCLQPRGDSFTRRSTFDCLLSGSIPVFFWHRTAYMQYKWHLPGDADSYSVFISKEAMRNGAQIEDVLNAYSPEKVKAMQEVVVGLIPRIVYAASGFSLREHKDAFDVTIEGIMKRFKEELRLSLQR